MLESALKYFILGTTLSGFFIFGVILLYSCLGVTNFLYISHYFSIVDIKTMSNISIIIINIAILFIVVSFLFKIGAAPFHQWTVDVYEGISFFMMIYFSTIVKFVFIMTFIRILGYVFIDVFVICSYILKISGLLCLFVGSFGGLVQKKIKRFFAYSSISHLGFILLALSSGDLIGIQAAIFYTPISFSCS